VVRRTASQVRTLPSAAWYSTLGGSIRKAYRGGWSGGEGALLDEVEPLCVVVVLLRDDVSRVVCRDVMPCLLKKLGAASKLTRG